MSNEKVTRRLPFRTRLNQWLYARGVYVKRTRNLPFGVDWLVDVKRIESPSRSAAILDVGANRGQTSVELAKAFPACVIHAFEPSPDTYRTLISNTKRYANVRTHNCALGDQCRTLNVKMVPDAATNSLVTGLLDRDPRAVSHLIEERTIASLMDELEISEISILKTDTEGYDAAVLDGAEPLLSSGRVHFVYTELTFDPTNALQSQFLQLHSRLTRSGLHMIGIYEQSYLQKVSTGSFCNALYVRRDLL